MKPSIPLDPELIAFAAFTANAAQLYSTQHPVARALGSQLLEHASLHRAANPSIDEKLKPAMDSIGARAKVASDPKVWGPKRWRLLHRQCLQFDARRGSEAELSPAFRTAVTSWVEQFATAIPCGDCKTHFAELLVKRPPKLDDLFGWSVDIHNDVNAALGAKVLSLEDARAHWQA